MKARSIQRMARPDIVRRVKQLLKSGLYETPLWMEAAERVPPTTGTITSGPTSKLLPGDLDIYTRHFESILPRCRRNPLELKKKDSYAPSRLARRAIELMEAGSGEGISFAEVGDYLVQEFKHDPEELAKRKKELQQGRYELMRWQDKEERILRLALRRALAGERAIITTGEHLEDELLLEDEEDDEDLSDYIGDGGSEENDHDEGEVVKEDNK